MINHVDKVRHVIVISKDFHEQMLIQHFYFLLWRYLCTFIFTWIDKHFDAMSC